MFNPTCWYHFLLISPVRPESHSCHIFKYNYISSVQLCFVHCPRMFCLFLPALFSRLLFIVHRFYWSRSLAMVVQDKLKWIDFLAILQMGGSQFQQALYWFIRWEWGDDKIWFWPNWIYKELKKPCQRYEFLRLYYKLQVYYRWWFGKKNQSTSGLGASIGHPIILFLFLFFIELQGQTCHETT